MKFIMIYGPSGVGKESIGRELAGATGWTLFPQHLAFDVACAVVGFGNDGFEKYQRKLCLEAFKSLIDKGVEGVIFTFCYVYPASNYFIDGLFKLLEENQIEAQFIRISCALEEHVGRVTSPGRKNTNKIQTNEYLDNYLAKFNFAVDIPGTNTFNLDSTSLSAAQASSEIIKQLNT